MDIYQQFLDEQEKARGLSPVGQAATQSGTPAIDSAVSSVTGQPDKEEDDFSVIDEIGRAVGTGATEMINAVGELPSDLGLTDTPVWEIEPLSEKPETLAGEIGATAVQFMIPYTGAFKVMNAFKFARAAGKVGKVSQALAAGAVTDFVAFEADDPFLSGLIQDTPALQNPITEFLAADEKDPAAMNRLRHAVEGLGLGLAFPKIIEGITKVGVGTGKMAVNATAGTVKAITPKPIADAANGIAKKAKEQVDVLYQKVSEGNLGAKKIAEQKEALGAKDFKESLTTYEWARVGNAKGTIQERATHKLLEFADDPVKGVHLKEVGDGIVTILNRTASYGKEALDDIEKLAKYSMAKQNKAKFGRRADELAAKRKEWLTDPKNAKKKMPEKLKKKQDFEADDISGGISSKEVSAFEREWAGKVLRDPGYAGKIEGSLKELGDMNKNLLGIMEREGMIDAATKARYLRDGDLHMYFHREKVIEDGFTTATKKVYGKKGDPSTQKLKAISEKDIEKVADVDDVMLNTIRAHTKIYGDIIDNRIKRKMYEGIEDIGKLTREKGMGEEAAKDAMSRWAVKLDSKDKKLIERMNRDYHVDTVKVAGKDEHWVLKDRFLVDQFQAMGPKSISEGTMRMLRAGRAFKTTASNLITLNPGFFLYANLLRDTVAVSVLSRSGFRPGVDSMKGLARTMGDYSASGYKKWANRFNPKKYHAVSEGSGGMFQDLKNQGGTFGKHVYAPEGMIRGEEGVFSKLTAKQQLKQAGVRAADPKHILDMKNNTKKFIERVEDFTSRFEYASRTEEYKRLLDLGYSHLKASILARDVAIDFGNRGTSTLFRAMTATVPFLNAHVQGITRTLRAYGAKRLVGGKLSKIEQEELGRVYAKTTTLAQISTLLYFYHQKSGELFGDESVREVYDGLDDYIKEKNGWNDSVPAYKDEVVLD